MKALVASVIVGGLVAIAFAAPYGAWDVDDAWIASSIEIGLDEVGDVGAVAYHVDESEVPAAVKSAMDALHPGGPYTGAEKERRGGTVYWALAREIAGLDVKALFTEAGGLHEQELEIVAASVPSAVLAGLQTEYPGVMVSTWTRVQDDEATALAYRARFPSDGRPHETVILPSGVITGSYFEVQAEIEVPAPPR